MLRLFPVGVRPAPLTRWEPNMTNPERLIAAVVEETVERGFEGVTVEGIVERSGLSLEDFEAHFESREQAVAVAYEEVFERFFARLVKVCRGQDEWPLKVKVGIALTLDLAAAKPVQARFLTADALVAGRATARVAMESRDRLARLLAAMRKQSPHGAELPSLTEQVLIGGLIGTISIRLTAGEARQLPNLAPQLVRLFLMPYIGREEAERIASRPGPGA